jgi:hypothetical protein
MWVTGEHQVFSGQQFQSVQHSSTEHKQICISSKATLQNPYFLENNLNLTCRKMVVKFQK